MKDIDRLIAWDAAFLIGIVLFFILNDPQHQKPIVGFSTVLIFSNCIKNHIAVYRSTGKIY